MRSITLAKYNLVLRELSRRIPEVRMASMNHYIYQKLINGYAQNHEFLTVKDFHHHIKAAIVDALDEGLIDHDPTKHIKLQGCSPRVKKTKYLSLLELKRLLLQLDLSKELNLDWLILLISKTGLRYSEALGITPSDFDFDRQTLTISKTWNYKTKEGGFLPTKNESSVRTIKIDPITADQFLDLTKDIPKNKPIFVSEGRKGLFSSTINSRLKRYCIKAGINTISVHGLRHTHASLLIYDGVSISSVAKRLGHANTITTQKTYLHVVKELEIKDQTKILENMIRLA